MPLTTSLFDSEAAFTLRSDPGHERSPNADGTASELAFCTRLGHTFNDLELLRLALRHRSWCAENGAVPSNERLEFLGDAVLGLVVTDELYRRAPNVGEGVLARARSELVSSNALGELARTISLGKALRLGRGEVMSGGRDKTSILADGMEAVLGAVYLDGGMHSGAGVILGLLGARIDDVLAGSVVSDHKSRLQEVAAQSHGELPQYDLSDDGPDHEKHFVAKVRIGESVLGSGEGSTKKAAEQEAARKALASLTEDEPPEITGPGSS